MSPRHALDGEILVQRADDSSLRLATTVNSAVSGMAPPLVMAASRLPRRGRNFSIHPVVMNVGAVASSPRRDSFGKHFEN